MRKFAGLLLVLAVIAGPLGARAELPPPPPQIIDPVDFVDPMIGTLGAGFVFPGPAVPYGMVQNSPDTEGWFAYTGYQYADRFIRGFSLVHTQSMGVPEGGQIPLMATTGEVVTDVKRYQSLFSHSTEEASAGYYKVRLDSYGVDAELAAGLRMGMQRYTFPVTAATGNILIDVGRMIAGSNFDDAGQSTPAQASAWATWVDPTTLLGSTNTDRAAGDRYPVHFAARFDRAPASVGGWASRGAPPVAGVTEISGKGAGVYATFDTAASRVVQVKIGISFVSPDNALLNLESEMPGAEFEFSTLVARARSEWRRALRAFEVFGNPFDPRPPDGLTKFYTALYHVQHHPNIFNDVNGEYLGYDQQIHRIGAPGDPMPAGSTYYANYSFWDTYRAEMPLLMLIVPSRVRDMMRSLGAIVQQGGRIPRWGWMDRYADFMNGEPGINVVADAYCRGLVPSDVLDVLYEDMRGLALDPARHRDPLYLQKGYIPVDERPGRVGSGASGTLEHAISDFALALMADRMGRLEDRDALLALAQNWRNVFDPTSRFARPRNGDGSWFGAPYVPELPDGWREGTGWQYSWLVPHDVRGLFDAMGKDSGGDGFVQQRLDTFFAPALAGGLGAEAQQKLSLYGIAYYGNQYAPSNEHDLQAPYLYNWSGQPWKTQELMRSYQELYRDAPDGLPGNDDLGTMSAWLVWSAIGLYPMIPGANAYTIGSPMFDWITVRSDGVRVFDIDAQFASSGARYIQVGLMGEDGVSGPWVKDRDLRAAGRLRLITSGIPSLTWGTDVRPPSASTSPLSEFGCTA